MPDAFLPRCEVEFTMPLATVSNTVVRSVSVEQHEDSDRVEKFVRYVAKCQYKVRRLSSCSTLTGGHCATEDFPAFSGGNRLRTVC